MRIDSKPARPGDYLAWSVGDVFPESQWYYGEFVRWSWNRKHRMVQIGASKELTALPLSARPVVFHDAGAAHVYVEARNQLGIIYAQRVMKARRWYAEQFGALENESLRSAI